MNDGKYILKKPVLFTEVGLSFHKRAEGSYDRGIFLKTVYDKIYDSAKENQAGAGALIWQLLDEGMEEYGDEFSLVAWEHPSIYKLIIEQSCRLRHVFEKDETGTKLSNSSLCT